MLVTLRAMRRQRRSGVRVIYVSSFTRPRTEYAVQHVRLPGRKRWACACPGFFYYWSVERRHCKHILLVRRWLAGIGGFRRARAGQSVAIAVDVTPPLFEEVT